ncbi:hypothetical protein [Roseomonas populi]|uniref:Uncharacterized protein n=1 Tax=Roseomonas populi TaxID=3121582 RepID=A0ABT1WXP7_9PROT|nr:hypothetical protein [Roseomonas pecuniae]MCR0980615.1 hypothetical protein [Roseomonas pecuniae]
MAHAIEAAGKSFVQASDYKAESLHAAGGAPKVVLACGPQGPPEPGLPAIALMNAGIAMPPEIRAICGQESFTVKASDVPSSGDDWQHDFAFDRTENLAILADLRGGGCRERGAAHAAQGTAGRQAAMLEAR